MTDDELLAGVNAAFSLLDPPPVALFASGRTALEHHLPHALLAELSADRDPGAAGVRSHSTRLLAFTLPGASTDTSQGPDGCAAFSGAPDVGCTISAPVDQAARGAEAGGEEGDDVLAVAHAGNATDGSLTIEAEVVGGRSVEVFGRLVPPVRAKVLLRHREGVRRTETDSDGHFAVDGIPSGPVSLVFDLANGVSVATSWIRL